MNTQNESTSSHSQQQPSITGATILAIISVTLAAGWIAFAYYKGVRADANRILLLHPIVPMLLIVLLSRVHRWIEIKSIVTLEILMMGVWLFLRMLGTLMPFILGFGFAYLFRFLWNAFPFKNGYLRGITTVVILVLCGIALFYSGRRVGAQAQQMGKGLQKFYHESLLPFVVGEKLNAMAIEESGETRTIYLGTNHSLYVLQEPARLESAPTWSRATIRKGITNGDIIGKSIQAIAVADNVIYAGTPNGLYQRNQRDEKPIWTELKNAPFTGTSVQAISIPSWDNSQIYIGTQQGLYSSDDSGNTWTPVAPETFGMLSIVSIVSIEETDENSKTVYVASTAGTAQESNRPARAEASNPQATTSVKSESTEEEQTAYGKGTSVHWHMEGSSLDWELLPSGDTVPLIHAIAAGDGAHAELYAGTSEGIHHWTALNRWQKLEEAELLPKSVSLLVAAPSGLYAGDEHILRYSPTATEKRHWEATVASKAGILNTYKDTSIGKQVQAYLTERVPSLAQTGGSAVKWVSGFAGSAAFQFGGLLATVSLAFIIFVYASQSFENYFRALTTLIPETYRATVKAYLREIDKNMQQYLKGQVTVIAIVSVLSSIVYSIIGVPFALLIGLLAGFCNAIPTFGPFIGGGFAFIAMLMGLAAGDFSVVGFLTRSAFLLGAILGIQMVDNSLISPKVMSSAVDVDPLLIMFAVIVGASVLGFWGVLLAIPIIVVIKSAIAVSQRGTTC